MDHRRVSSPNATLVAMCLGLFVAQFDATAVNLALPRIQASLRADAALLPWILDVYNVVFACLLLTGGTLGDRFGRRRVFLVGLVTFGLGSLLCGIAPSMGWLLVGRAVQGLGAAIELPNTLSVIRVAFVDPAERTRAVGLWAGVSGIALSLAPTAGALMIDAFGWGSIFLMNLPIGAFTFWLTYTRVAESSQPVGDGARRRIDVLGQLLAVIALGALSYGVIESHRGSLVVALLGAVAFVRVERRARAPMVDMGVFRTRAFRGALAVAASMTFGMYGQLFVVGTYFERVRGESALAAGLHLLPHALTFALVSPLSGRLTRILGARTILTIGALFMALGLFAFSWCIGGSHDALMGPSLAVSGVGLGLSAGVVMAVAVANVPARRVGMASGLGNTARLFGATLGVAAFGAIVATDAATTGMRRALDTGGIVELLGAAFAFALIPAAATAPADVAEASLGDLRAE